MIFGVKSLKVGVRNNNEHGRGAGDDKHSSNNNLISPGKNDFMALKDIVVKK